MSASAAIAIDDQAETINVKARTADFAAVRKLLTPETPILHEAAHETLSQVVVKPWGHESRIFCDPVYDLWHLCIRKDGSTSMHAHLRKKTQLLCLSGEGTFTTLHGTYTVRPGTIMTIGRGAFHQTRSTSEELHLIEVETPRNKFDLIRLHDNYDRTRTTYETEVMSAGESPLKPLLRVPHTYLRRISTGARYSFSIRTGMDIFYTPRPNDIFYVPVGLESFISDHPVLSHIPGTKTPVLTDQSYLAIART